MLFPDFIIEEILTSISKSEILEYRLVNKNWDTLLRPFVLNSLDFNPENEHDPKFLTLLPKFGKHIKELCFGYLNFGESLPLQDWEIKLIQENCPNIEALKFNRKKHEGDVSDILKLGVSLPKIKHVSLLGKLKLRKLLLLQPLIYILESLEVECVCDNVRAQNRFIHRLSSPSLKKLSLQCRLQAGAFSLIGTEFPSDLTLQISKGGSRHNITYVFNREIFMFNSVEFFDEDADLRMCVRFDLSQEKKAASHWRIYEGIREKNPSEQFKFVESIFVLGSEPYLQAETHLPPIKSFSYCNRFLKSERINTFFRQMNSVQEIQNQLGLFTAPN
ncbi:hypothetical protein DSO57_1012004 [Entomophthora muscae]|uniref:Uncharacterized protein n=1 Tax=Entomophthora muscae TaxID=34485 RepID=A0ACC2UGK8_9FUNG|nr:hypothetical protein DSO57_1012004 [Entomophthora muscae]